MMIWFALLPSSMLDILKWPKKALKICVSQLHKECPDSALEQISYTATSLINLQ